MIKRKAASKNEFIVLRVIPSIVILLVLGFILRLILSPFGTLTLDQGTFIAWSQRLINVPLTHFYDAWSDYLPGYLYVLNFLAYIAKLKVLPETILYKLPAMMSDVITGYFIYKIVRKLKSEKWALISTSLYIFNPAILANSTLWGQADSLVALFSILTIYTLESNFLLSAIFLACGTIIKPQAAMVAAIVFLVMIMRRWKIKKIYAYILTAFFVFVGLFMPFNNSANLANFIVTRLNATFGQYPYTAINAFNFWGIFGQWKPDMGLQIVGLVIIGILFFAYGIKMLQRKGGEYILLAYLYALSFMFMTRMHERHLLPVFAPLAIAIAVEPFFVFAYIGFSFIYTLNLYWAWVWVTDNFRDAFGELAMKILSLINVLLVAIFVLPRKMVENKIKIIENLKFKEEKKYSFEKTKVTTTLIRKVFVVVIIFAAVGRMFSLHSPTNEYFDEVYHAFTARAMLNGNTKAWEWWNPNPEGFAYEWTHPPIAKEVMAVSMKILGEQQFAWRLPGAILGVGSIVVVYFLAKKIFDDELLALIAASALALDGLFLVLNRIGMNDSYMLFFALASVLMYLKKKNFWSAVTLGLALASKWSALWVIPIIFIAHFVWKNKIGKSYLWFFVIPPLIYLGSYFPLFTNSQIQREYMTNANYATKADKLGIVPFDMFLDTQKQMWWYHTNLKATHAYSSPWYSWPFLVRPIYLYTSDEVNDRVARIYAMGNPIVFWVGTLSVVILAYFALKERSKKLGFIVFGYLVFFTPWAISPRIMFLYHYLPSVPFMAIAIGYVLRRYKEFLAGFVIVSLLSFIYFYPHWAGLKIPLILDSSYYWFTSWR